MSEYNAYRLHAARRDLSKLEPSPCTIRPMTAEEREKYGEPNLDPALLRRRKKPEDVGIYTAERNEAFVEAAKWSERVRNERARLGVTQKEFAKMAGLQTHNISLIERMQYTLKTAVVEKLKEYFGEI